jgi:hypothetical protein
VREPGEDADCAAQAVRSLKNKDPASTLTGSRFTSAPSSYPAREVSSHQWPPVAAPAPLGMRTDSTSSWMCLGAGADTLFTR